MLFDVTQWSEMFRNCKFWFILTLFQFRTEKSRRGSSEDDSEEHAVSIDTCLTAQGNNFASGNAILVLQVASYAGTRFVQFFVGDTFAGFCFDLYIGG